MESKIERLVEGLVGLVDSLVVEVREMRRELEDMRLILERLLGRKLKRVEGKVGEVRLEVGDLSREELELLKVFWQWVLERKKEWSVSYDNGEMEGFDKKRGLILLKRGTMQEFLDRAFDLGYSKQGVLKLLGDLGILRYWEREGKRQYCIAVRITKPNRSMVSGYYVMIEKRLSEVLFQLKSILKAEKRIEGVTVAGNSILVREVEQTLEEEIEEVDGGFED